MKTIITETEYKNILTRIRKVIDVIGKRIDVSTKAHSHLLEVQLILIDLKHCIIKSNNKECLRSNYCKSCMYVDYENNNYSCIESLECSDFILKI